MKKIEYHRAMPTHVQSRANDIPNKEAKSVALHYYILMVLSNIKNLKPPPRYYVPYTKFYIIERLILA
jgi:hypothetical protein